MQITLRVPSVPGTQPTLLPLGVEVRAVVPFVVLILLLVPFQAISGNSKRKGLGFLCVMFPIAVSVAYSPPQIAVTAALTICGVFLIARR